MKKKKKIPAPKEWNSATLNLGSPRMKKVLKYIPRDDGYHLDVGAGDGCGTIVVSKIKKTKCLEYGERSYKRCIKKGLDVVHGSAAKMPFPDDFLLPSPAWTFWSTFLNIKKPSLRCFAS